MPKIHLDRPFLVAVLLALASMPTTAAPIAPPNPHVDNGACPFECCTYRDWKTTKPVTLLDKPHGQKIVTSVPAGQVVHGVTGNVYSVPVRTVAAKSFKVSSNTFQNASIRKGEVFYVLHYLGEGATLIWFKGKTYDAELEPVSATAEGPPSDGPQWWVKVRTLSGKSGWVLDKDQFDEQDACG